MDSIDAPGNRALGVRFVVPRVFDFFEPWAHAQGHGCMGPYVSAPLWLPYYVDECGTAPLALAAGPRLND